MTQSREPGYQEWKDEEEDVNEWALCINVSRVGAMGGIGERRNCSKLITLASESNAAFSDFTSPTTPPPHQISPPINPIRPLSVSLIPVRKNVFAKFNPSPHQWQVLSGSHWIAMNKNKLLSPEYSWP